MSSTPLLTHYFNEQKKAEQLYGSHSVVLFQKGGFYNIFEYDLPNNKIGKSSLFSKVCKCLLSSLDKKKPHSIKNPKQIGFPVMMIQKYIGMIVDYNYKALVFNEFPHPTKSCKLRKLVKIYSKSTDMEYNKNDLVALQIDTFTSIKNVPQKHVSLIHINVSTGQIIVHDIIQHYSKTDEDVIRILNSIQPCEILMQESDDILIQKVKKYFDTRAVIRLFLMDKCFTDLNYQKEILLRTYSSVIKLPLQNHSHIFPLLTYLLDFVYQHDHTILSYLQIPKIQTSKFYYNLDAFQELHILKNGEDGQGKSLLNIIDKTKTAMGGRFLKHRLLNCITDKKKLTERYDRVDDMIHKSTYQNYQTYLRNINDLEKKFHKLYLQRLTPTEILLLRKSFKNTYELLKYEQSSFTEFYDFYEHYTKTFSTDKERLFNEGVYPHIDKLYKTFEKNQHKITTFLKTVAKKFHLKLRTKTEKTIIYQQAAHLEVSSSRWNKIKKNIRTVAIDADTTISICDFKAVSKGSSIKLFHPTINALLSSLQDIDVSIKNKTNQTFKKLLIDYKKKYNNVFNNVVQRIKEVDVLCSAAEVAVTYNYTRPFLHESDLIVKDIRHPIIERVNEIEEYITNDVKLHPKTIGMLLYGINTSGKSSYLRAVGCNVILSQAGFFVSASTFRTPIFKQMITKISNQDDFMESTI